VEIACDKHCHVDFKFTHNNRINSDWQFRCASLPAGYAERWEEAINTGNYNITSYTLG